MTAWMHPLLRTTVHSATTAAQCDGFHSCGHTRLHCGTARRLWTNSASASVGIGCCGRARIGSYSIPYLDRGTSSVGCISYTASILRKPSDHCVPLDSVRCIASHRIASHRIAYRSAAPPIATYLRGTALHCRRHGKRQRTASLGPLHGGWLGVGMGVGVGVRGGRAAGGKGGGTGGRMRGEGGSLKGRLARVDQVVRVVLCFFERVLVVVVRCKELNLRSK